MLKNIKLFSTDSDRTTYESSASYETPYVSKVTTDNSVHYNRPAQIMNFRIRIGGHIYAPCQAESGMTFQEWVNSEYNDMDCYINSCSEVRFEFQDYDYGIIYDDSFCLPSDIIVGDRTYISDASTDCF